jgi:hypothetical protein
VTVLHYLASPYSRFAGGLDAAYRLACEQTALLIRAGVPVVSPIAATHGVALHGGIDALDHAFWLAADVPLMEACTGLIMLQAPGWALSEGMRIEREAFHAAGKPIIWMTPGVVPRELLSDPSAGQPK